MMPAANEGYCELKMYCLSQYVYFLDDQRRCGNLVYCDQLRNTVNYGRGDYGGNVWKSMPKTVVTVSGRNPLLSLYWIQLASRFWNFDTTMCRCIQFVAFNYMRVFGSVYCRRYIEADFFFRIPNRAITMVTGRFMEDSISGFLFFFFSDNINH